MTFNGRSLSLKSEKQMKHFLNCKFSLHVMPEKVTEMPGCEPPLA